MMSGMIAFFFMFCRITELILSLNGDVDLITFSVELCSLFLHIYHLLNFDNKIVDD